MLMNDAVSNPTMWVKKAKELEKELSSGGAGAAACAEDVRQRAEAVKTYAGDGNNVAVVVVDVRGMPFPFLVCTQDVAEGRPLCRCAGSGRWRRCALPLGRRGIWPAARRHEPPRSSRWPWPRAWHEPATACVVACARACGPRVRPLMLLCVHAARTRRDYGLEHWLRHFALRAEAMSAEEVGFQELHPLLAACAACCVAHAAPALAACVVQAAEEAQGDAAEEAAKAAGVQLLSAMGKAASSAFVLPVQVRGGARAPRAARRARGAGRGRARSTRMCTPSLHLAEPSPASSCLLQLRCAARLCSLTLCRWWTWSRPSSQRAAPAPLTCAQPSAAPRARASGTSRWRSGGRQWCTNC